MASYVPPFTITPSIVRLISDIAEQLGRYSVEREISSNLRLRRINRIRTIRGSLAIEGNTLTETQITAILEGKRVVASPREVQEVRNAIKAYDRFERWDPGSGKDLLEAVGSGGTPGVTPEVAPEVKKMLLVIEGEMTRRQIQARLGLKDEKHFREKYLQPAVGQGLIEMTVADKPNSRLQKYRITPKGVRYLREK